MATAVRTFTCTVKPPIIPAGREQHEAGNKGRMERGGGLGTSATGNWSKRETYHDGEDENKCYLRPSMKN